MSRSLLDTNIIGKVTKPMPSEALVAWMAEQSDEDLFISSLPVAEIRRGILEKPLGKKRRELEDWFSGPEGPPALFAGRVLPLDEKAGLVWARLMADGTAKGRPRSPLDMIVAATLKRTIAWLSPKTNETSLALRSSILCGRTDDEPKIWELPGMPGYVASTVGSGAGCSARDALRITR